MLAVTDNAILVTPELVSFASNAEIVGQVIPGEPVIISGEFVDAGSLDVHTVRIDWGDGGAVEEVTLAVGARSFDIEHFYALPGFFDIDIELVDDDGGVDTGATDAKLTGVELVDGKLRIAGTTEADIVEIRLLDGGSDSDGDSDGDPLPISSIDSPLT